MKEFNVADYELNETAVLTVKNAARDAPLLVDGKPVKITLFGPASPEYVKAQHKKANAGVMRGVKILQGSQPEDAAELASKEAAVLLAECTKSIENFPVEPLAIYTNPKLVYITDQVDQFLRREANFTKG